MNICETYSGNNVPKRTKWIYSTVATFRDACYALVSMFLITFIQYSGVLTRGLPASATSEEKTALFVVTFGVITALVIGYRIFDALNDPFMGVIIEKTHFKTGKYKPWILIGGLTNSVVVLALFLAPQLFSWLSGWAYIAWFAVFYLLWGLTFTMNDIAYWGMLPSLTNDERKRNTITTLMSIFCSIGQFVVAGLSPILSGAFGYQIYPIIAIIVCSLFAIAQIILFLFLKEHKREDDTKVAKEKASFKDMFTVLRKNDQALTMVIALFVYYLGSGILNTLGLNYFYFAINYSVGSGVMTYFTIIYGVGYLLSQILFPLITKKLSWKKIIIMTFFGLVIGYIAFFIYGLPLGDGKYIGPSPLVIANGKTSLNILYLIPLCIIGLVIFFCQGLFYLTLLIMMTNTIEYNEYKFGERKEAVIFSLRPLTTKLASALQQGVLYLFLIIASLSGVISTISTYQNQATLGEITTTELSTVCDSTLSSIQPWQVIVFKLGLTLLPLLLFVASFLVIKFKYHIDENEYRNMVTELNNKNEQKGTEQVQ